MSTSERAGHGRLAAGVAIGALLVGGSVLGGMAAFGPLDPPAGPPSDTSPSLADLEAKIDAISSDLQGPIAASGPWQVAAFNSSLQPNVQSSSVQVGTGPVLLHSIVAFATQVVAFDGAGSISGSRPVFGTVPVGAIQDTVQFSSGPYDIGSSQAIYNVICNDGLHISYNSDSSAAWFVYVYYRELQ